MGLHPQDRFGPGAAHQKASKTCICIINCLWGRLSLTGYADGVQGRARVSAPDLIAPLVPGAERLQICCTKRVFATS